MRRQLIVAGLAMFAVLLFVFITATLAAPGNIPLLQSPEEEPNDSFDEADLRPKVPVPGYVTGVVSDTDAMDYFKMDTQVGHQYQASLSVLHTTGDLNLMMRLYNGDEGLIGSSSSSISWTAYQASHYIRVEALLATTTTVQTADYPLDIDELAATPTPTDTPVPTDTPGPTNTPISDATLRRVRRRLIC